MTVHSIGTTMQTLQCTIKYTSSKTRASWYRYLQQSSILLSWCHKVCHPVVKFCLLRFTVSFKEWKIGKKWHKTFLVHCVEPSVWRGGVIIHYILIPSTTFCDIHQGTITKHCFTTLALLWKSTSYVEFFKIDTACTVTTLTDLYHSGM